MKKVLLVLLTISALVVGINTKGENVKPAPQTSQTISTTEKTYWPTIKSNIRHNSKCKYYHHSKGRPCEKDEGKPCKICGG